MSYLLSLGLWFSILFCISYSAFLGCNTMALYSDSAWVKWEKVRILMVLPAGGLKGQNECSCWSFGQCSVPYGAGLGRVWWGNSSKHPIELTPETWVRNEPAVDGLECECVCVVDRRCMSWAEWSDWSGQLLTLNLILYDCASVGVRVFQCKRTQGCKTGVF